MAQGEEHCIQSMRSFITQFSLRQTTVAMMTGQLLLLLVLWLAIGIGMDMDGRWDAVFVILDLIIMGKLL
jgi:hypothetical protein